jgi:DNA modification methylase
VCLGHRLTALTVVYLPIEQLIPYARNSRTHSDAQIAQIAGSIREFSFTNPVLVDGDGGIIAGHGRLLAARQLGMQAVPCIRLGHLSPTQRKALIIADNKLALNAGWDESLLSLELQDLQSDGFDLGLTGFSGDELDALLADRTAGLTDPDDAPEPPVNPVTVLGDVWIMGKHRIICGSATDADTVAKALNGVKPHLMVTDPPYGVNYDPTWRIEAGRTHASMNRPKNDKGAVGKVENDANADWREAWALFPGDVAYVWHGGNMAHTVAESLIACGLEIRAQIIWAKNQFVIGRGHYHPHHEPCWYAVRKGGTGHWAGDRKQSTIWQIDKPKKSETGHSTQKPVACMKRPIENNSSPGQAVYEPFSGSGTTIIAAEMTGRACHAIELNPAYVDVAVQRWQEFTGQVAVLEATGQTFADVCEQRYAGGEWAANCAGSYDDAVAGARKMIEAAE